MSDADEVTSRDTSDPSEPPRESKCSGECQEMSMIELEASSAIREVAPFVKNIYLSDVLCRTSDLLFLNLVTLEDRSYCIELSPRGWRVCSDRHDCMYGDFRRVDFHARYYETIYVLLDSISALYQQRFAEALAEKLRSIPPQ